MAEKKLVIEPSLFITEYENWTFLMVKCKVYKIKMTETERKNLYEVIKAINQNGKLNEKEYVLWETSYLALQTIGGITDCVTMEQCENVLIVKRIEGVDNVDMLNQYCVEGGIHFECTENGYCVYLTENEMILSKNEMKFGKYVHPKEKQRNLIVQVLQKNKQEILQMMQSYSQVAMPLLGYASGVRVIKDKIIDVSEVSDYVGFQPWNAKITIDGDSCYPLVNVRCEIRQMVFTGSGLNTDLALYQIYEKNEVMRKMIYE